MKSLFFTPPKHSLDLCISQPVWEFLCHTLYLKKYPFLEFSISATSRAPRGSERDGVEYYFYTESQFRALISQDAFVEYEEVYPGSFYGTLRSEVERIWAKDHVILFDIDVKGGVNLKRIFGDSAMSVFVRPPSIEELRRRLESRGTDSPEAIERRVAKAAEELEYEGRFDKVLENDRLEHTLAEADSLIEQFTGRKA